MPALHTQNVLRHDRKHAAKSVRPESGRANKNSYTDAADVRAREIEPLAEKDPSQYEFGNECGNNRQRSSFITLEDPVKKMAHQQDETDKERRDVTIVEANSASCGNFQSTYWLDAGLDARLAHAASLIL